MGIKELFTGKDPRVAQLAELEAIVERGLTAWQEVAAALTTIRDDMLYRLTHPTFEHYLQDRWGLKSRRAYQLIRAGQVAQTLNQGAEIQAPTSERQVRPLAGLSPDQQRQAWATAVAVAPKDDDGKAHVTAAIVADAVDQVAPKRKRKARKKLRPFRIKIPHGVVIIERRNEGLTAAKALADALEILTRQQTKAA